MKKKTIMLGLTALALAGCASFSTTQVDERITDGTGKETTKITTKAASRTLFNSKSNLAKWRATQTERSQGAEVGGLHQEASGTNFVNALGHVEGIIKAIRPTP